MRGDLTQEDVRRQRRDLIWDGRTGCVSFALHIVAVSLFPQRIFAAVTVRVRYGIYVKTLTGKTIAIKADASDEIEFIKLKIQTVEGMCCVLGRGP